MAKPLGVQRTAVAPTAFEQRRQDFRAEKLAIARYVVKNCLDPQKVLFLGTGTTVMEIAQEIAIARPRLPRVCTNNLAAVLHWAERDVQREWEVPIEVVGGELIRGQMAVENRRMPAVSQVIIGCFGVSGSRGILANNRAEFDQHRAVLKSKAKQIIIVADRSKIGRPSNLVVRSALIVQRDVEKKGRSYILVTNAVSRSGSLLEEDVSVAKELSELKKRGVRVVEVEPTGR